jgi:ACR3 family arsenite transporter
MNIFERYLSLWVALSILLGIFLGEWFPSLFQSIAQAEFAHINLPICLLVWMMIIPMLMKVDFNALGQLKQHWRGIGITLFVNWAVKPFSMALFAYLFIRLWFAPYLPAENIDSYIAGLILLAAAPCTAMVFVWSRLTNGNPIFTLSQVALNDVIMLFAFAPLVALLLGISAIAVPWLTLLTSVLMYILIPVLIAQALRALLLKPNPGQNKPGLVNNLGLKNNHELINNKAQLDRFMHIIGPYSMAALLLTLVLLFAFQGNTILAQPVIIALIAIPIIVQVVFNAGFAYWLNKQAGEQHAVACPSALIGASNFFELAVATAISVFGLHSGAALATVVGVLVEVPLMLLVVRCVNHTKHWYQS